MKNTGNSTKEHRYLAVFNTIPGELVENILHRQVVKIAAELKQVDELCK